MKSNLHKLKLRYPGLGRCQNPQVGPIVPIIAQGTHIGLLFDSIRMIYIAPVFPNMFLCIILFGGAALYTHCDKSRKQDQGPIETAKLILVMLHM